MERMDDVFVQNSTSAVRQFQLSDLISVGGAEQSRAELSWPQLLVVMVVVVVVVVRFQLSLSEERKEIYNTEDFFIRALCAINIVSAHGRETSRRKFIEIKGRLQTGIVLPCLLVDHA